MLRQPLKISVVTISYNQASYLQACIDSVAKQIGCWEHIIVDAGSTDGSREIIEKNRAHFSEVIFEKDDGPADGLNKGFAKATGTHGYFLNSDDFLMPNAFLAFFNHMHENISNDLILFSGWVVDCCGSPVRTVRSTKTTLRHLLDGSAILFQQGLFFPIRSFRQVGGFNPHNRTIWDFELVCALLSNGSQAVIRDERIAAFRVYPGTISSQSHVGYHSQYILDRNRVNLKFSYKTRRRFSSLSGFCQKLKKYLLNMVLIQDKFEFFFQPKKIHRKWIVDYR